MLQRPLRQARPAVPASTGASTPAPVGGWNARDSIADMPVEDAVILKNWFPGTSRCRVRRGHTAHATAGILTTEAGNVITTEAGNPLAIDGSPVGTTETLMVYADGNSQEMFAVADGDIIDVTTASSPVATGVSGLANDRLQWVNMGTSAGRFLLAVNGGDDMRKYDGTNWGVVNAASSPAITGVATADIIHINVFKRRVFLIEKDSLSFWYLPPDAIGGAAAEFDLSAQATLGGYLMAMGTWTRDGGDGIDDFAVFYTSEGEVIIYQGTDPGDATAWTLVGTFKIGAPVGRRCMEKVGSDLILITVDGFVPMSRALANARTNQVIALSDKIRDAVNEAVRLYGSNFGWQGVLYPKGQWLLFNIPTSEGETAEQYVANTTTGAWCRFTGMNANCWVVFNDDIYFGGSDLVAQADDGLDDNGSDIETDVQQAFSYFSRRGLLKRFTMVRPLLDSDGSLNVAIAVNVDFENKVPTSTPSYASADQLVTQVGDLIITEADEEIVLEGTGILKAWQSVSGIGHAAALRMQTTSQNIETFWASTDWVYEPSQGGLV